MSLLHFSTTAALATIARVVCLLFLFISLVVSTVHGAAFTNSVVCRPELSPARRQELAAQLREITGWRELSFDQNGVMRPGSVQVGGSVTAREMLRAASSGPRLVILEDASERADIVFCRVVEGRWVKQPEAKPPVSIVLIDFKDFSHVVGDRDAMATFNIGWGVLHEISHVIHDSLDADRAGEVGQCEQLINRMRRECNLAERAEYFFTFYPGMERSEFKTRYVRLAFEQQQPVSGKKRRLWLMWDATLVGGL